MDDPPKFEGWMKNVGIPKSKERQLSVTNPFHPVNFDIYDFDIKELNKPLKKKHDGNTVKALSRLEKFKPFSPLRTQQLLNSQATLTHTPQKSPTTMSKMTSETSISSPASQLTERDVIRNDVRSATVRLLSLLSNEEDKKRQLQNENQMLKKCITELKYKLKQADERGRQKDAYVEHMINQHKVQIDKINNINKKHLADTTKKYKEESVDKKKYEALELDLTVLKKKYNELEINKKKSIQNLIKMHNESSKNFIREKQNELRKMRHQHKLELSKTIEEIEYAAMDAVKNVYMAHVITSENEDGNYDESDAEYETNAMDFFFKNKMKLDVTRKLQFEIGSVEGLWPIPPEEQRGDDKGDNAFNFDAKTKQFQSPNKRRVKLNYQ